MYAYVPYTPAPADFCPDCDYLKDRCHCDYDDDCWGAAFPRTAVDAHLEAAYEDGPG